MGYNFVTIEREYGSGATEIGRRLAEKLGIKCYGEEILTIAAERMGTTPDQIRKEEEKTTTSLLHTLAMMGNLKTGLGAELPEGVRLHALEQMIIQELPKFGKAIVIGRCASYALKDRDDVLRVFIKSRMQDRKERAVKEYGIREKDAESVLKKADKVRANYYYSISGADWKDPGQYSIILDSHEIGMDVCVEILAALVTLPSKMIQK